MNQISFLQGLEASLPSMHTPGTIYFTTDTHKFYIALSENECVPLNAENASKIDWNNIQSQPNIYLGIRQSGETDNQAIERILSSNSPKLYDVVILKTLIVNDKYSYVAFVYDNGWYAMDGNVDATNVIMPNDIITAGSYTQVGNITKGATATSKIATKGKSVADVFTAIFTQELNPGTTQPAVTCRLTNAGAKEAGTIVAPAYTTTFSAGSYTYGPATGITATAWNITDTAGNSLTTASGTMPNLIVTDGISYKITAIATHGAGTIPVTNLGNAYAAGQIAAGTKSGTSSAITAYRQCFYGTSTNASNTVNSTFIRSLTPGGKAAAANQTYTMTIPEGTRQVFIAVPPGRMVTKVEDTGAMNQPIQSAFITSTVSVEGANGYTSQNYTVYTYSPAIGLNANSYIITLG